MADTITPVAAFLQIVEADDRTGFLLESVEGGERWGRYSFVGRNPLATITARGTAVTTEGDLDLDAATGQRVSGSGGVLAALEAILATFDSPDLPDLPPLHAGLVGYLGYDVVREVEHLPDTPPDDLGPSRRHPGRHRPAGRLRPLAPAGGADRQRGHRPDVVVRPTRRRPTSTPWTGSTTWPPSASDHWTSRPDCDRNGRVDPPT